MLAESMHTIIVNIKVYCLRVFDAGPGRVGLVKLWHTDRLHFN